MSLENIYFKILGVTLVLTVTCGGKALASQDLSKILESASHSDYHTLVIGSNENSLGHDDGINLDFVFYLIDLQAERDVCINILFQYCKQDARRLFHQNNIQPLSAIVDEEDWNDHFSTLVLRRHFYYSTPSPTSDMIGWNLVRAGPLAS